MAKEPTAKVLAKIHTPKGLKGKNYRENFEPPLLMTLRQMQDFVGGYIEYVPSIYRGVSVVVNEEGLYKPLLENDLATSYVRNGVFMVAPVQGNALLVETDSHGRKFKKHAS